MRSTPEEIRRRIAKRKKEMGSSGNRPEREINWPGDDEKYGFNNYSSYDPGKDDDIHPLFKKEVFIFKILASALLFLVIAIMFRENTATFAPAKDFVVKTMEQDFKFATVSKWYEDQFGKPLALLPFSEEGKESDKTVVEKDHDIPVFSGKVLENFEKNGQGIMIETTKGAAVEAMKEGNVMFAGVKEDTGKTVIIQHADQTQSTYGNLDEIKVSLYQFIETETVVGTALESTGEDKTKGTYYFAIKKGDDFIDPIQVIRFE
ncbi:M23 family metallopeptidase [Neobacillus niacini]|jgi:stage IV sporulation protein FA|uniref:M23 family metallopeptidase n=1 Tax=Neobacillus niacini TaxID=86668 RepID=UPI001C8E3AEA|nr:M23 family metallopeptidase [Neobacillus niacini]MBY0146707.1 M23 family metallopeptidase [Neobacillus niacini]